MSCCGRAWPLGRSGFEVTGQASDGPRLLVLVREAVPDLVVADIRMPPTHTAEEWPDTPGTGTSGHCELTSAAYCRPA
jgi:DNA-binding NarL/FixJ family response regulator